MLLLSLIPKRPLLNRLIKTQSWRYLSYKHVNNRALGVPINNTVTRLHPFTPTLNYVYCTRVYTTRNTPLKGDEVKQGEPPTGDTQIDNDKKTKRQESRNKLTRILREYGTVAIVFHTSMSLCVLSVCYMIVKSGVDVENFLKYFKIDSSRYSTASTFAVSYIIYKILLPIRATITVTCVPLIVRSLRARGWMKTPSQTQPPSSTPPPNN